MVIIVSQLVFSLSTLIRPRNIFINFQSSLFNNINIIIECSFVFLLRLEGIGTSHCFGRCVWEEQLLGVGWGILAICAYFLLLVLFLRECARARRGPQRKFAEIGVVVTLRGPRMYDFLEKLINVTFPRVRDFHGISDKAFDRPEW